MTEETRVNLKEFVLKIFEEQEKSLIGQLRASERALELATHNMEIRLHNLNEWKNQTIQERGRFVQCEVFEKSMDGVNDKINGLERSLAASTGMIKILLPVAGIFGGLLGAAIAILFK
jgi:hypothetical protein